MDRRFFCFICDFHEKIRFKRYSRESNDSKKRSSRRACCGWFNNKQRQVSLLGACLFVALISSS